MKKATKPPNYKKIIKELNNEIANCNYVIGKLNERIRAFDLYEYQNKEMLLKIRQTDLAFEELYKNYCGLQKKFELEQQKKTPLLTKIKLWLKPN
jgi:hypothetical protein